MIMVYKIVLVFLSLVFAVQARPGNFKQDVDGNDCEWPWCKFCPSEYLGLLCKLCPLKTTPAQPEVTTPVQQEPSSTPSVENPTDVPPQGPKLRVNKNFEWPWCKYCSEIDLGFLCQLCNCTDGKPFSTIAPEVPSEEPSVGPENGAHAKFRKVHLGFSKQEIIESLQDCEWPWCKFCPNDRLGLLCKLCPAKTTHAPESTASIAEPTKQPTFAPSEGPSVGPENEATAQKIQAGENFDFPWCKFCNEFDLGFLCKLCNCSSGKPASTTPPAQLTEKPSEVPETEAPVTPDQPNIVHDNLQNSVRYQKFRKQLRPEMKVNVDQIHYHAH
uniref:RanBP2-type domain-containing protein n=1 Tax=Acrobeloides nanus TaxID=290746 RepID=A0A914E6A3_9BILA